jgi:hypothetical protein
MKNWNLEGKYCEGSESVIKYGTNDRVKTSGGGK